MSSYKTENIRNIALVGHAGCGKTTLAEALLQATGTIGVAGSVEKGNTVCDFDAQEQAFQHSLDSTICGFDHAAQHVNLIDTPGYPDLVGRALAVLPAVETAAVVINAQSGIESVTQRVLEKVARRGMCRMIIINKIDAPDLDLQGLLSTIQSTFGSECLPLNLPIDKGAGVVDCFFAPEPVTTDFSSIDEAHTRIIDQVVEVDEALMEVYLEQGQALQPEQLHEPFEKAMREGHLVPVCFVSARTGAGLAQLLDVFARLMPNPMEGTPPPFLKGEGESAVAVEVLPDAERHAIAHVFKIAIDQFVGRMGVFRVHQGTISSASQLFIGNATKPFKVAHLFRLQGKDHFEIPRAIPGDICAVAKVEDLHFDAVLHDSHDEDHYHLKSLSLPQPMYGLALEPERPGDEQKISDALHKLEAEDPSVAIEHNHVANETVLKGCGELHLRVLLEKLRDRYNVGLQTKPPSINYRETVTLAADGHYRHKKQTGGAGQFGEVFLRVEPGARDSGLEIVNRVVGGTIPTQFIPAVEKGIQQAVESGAVAGYQLVDLKVTILDGKHHPVDSKEVAFVTAGKRAVFDAVAKAKPIVLEPVVQVDITAPENAIGDIAGKLSAKRGRINGTELAANGKSRVSGQAPLAELDTFQSELTSMTGGEGQYAIEFSHYEQVPPKLQQELIAAYKRHDDDS